MAGLKSNSGGCHCGATAVDVDLDVSEALK